MSRLKDLGLAPDDVPIVVNTHLDPDHCGHNDAFPASRIVVQRDNLAAARTSGEMRFEWQRAHWDAWYWSSCSSPSSPTARGSW